MKGLGEAAVEAILAARGEGGPFRSLLDFAGRVDPRKINKKVLEALVKSGAFDFEGLPRWRLHAGIDAAIAAGAAAQADRASGQASLFGTLGAAADATPRYPAAGDQVGAEKALRRLKALKQEAYVIGEIKSRKTKGPQVELTGPPAFV